MWSQYELPHDNERSRAITADVSKMSIQWQVFICELFSKLAYQALSSKFIYNLFILFCRV